MKKTIAIVLLVAISLPAFAIEDGEVMYVGGTVPGFKEGSVGRLDSTQATQLSFEYSGKKMDIPFAKIEEYNYSEELAHHLGVLPTVAVGLFKHRRRRHFFRISFRDENNVAQAAIFEVPKTMPQSLLAVLEARAPQGCKKKPVSRCRQNNY